MEEEKRKNPISIYAELQDSYDRDKYVYEKVKKLADNFLENLEKSDERKVYFIASIVVLILSSVLGFIDFDFIPNDVEKWSLIVFLFTLITSLGIGGVYAESYVNMDSARKNFRDLATGKKVLSGRISRKDSREVAQTVIDVAREKHLEDMSAKDSMSRLKNVPDRKKRNNKKDDFEFDDDQPSTTEEDWDWGQETGQNQK